MSYAEGAQSGAASGFQQGAQAGGSVGPWGAVVGGVIGAAAGAISGYQAARRAKKRQRRLRRALAEAKRRAAADVAKYTGEGTTYSKVKSFIDETYSAGGNRQLGRSVAQAVQSAQASRGLMMGNISALAEARAVGLAGTKLQAQLAPFAQQFEMAPLRLQNELTSNYFRNDASVITPGAQSLFEGSAQGFLSGAAGGAQLGSVFDDYRQAQSSQALQQQMFQDRQAAAAGGQGGTAVDSFLSPAT